MYYQLQATKTKGQKCSDTSLKINGPFLNSAQWTLFKRVLRQFNLGRCDIFRSPVWNLQVIYKLLQNSGILKLYFVIGLIRELIRWNIQKKSNSQLKPLPETDQLHNAMLGAQSVTDSPITMKRVFMSLVFCSTLFGWFPVSKAGFLLQERFRIVRYKKQIKSKDRAMRTE